MTDGQRTMADTTIPLDPTVLLNSGQRYSRLRRRYGRSMVCFAGLIVLSVIFMPMAQSAGPLIRGVVGFVTAIGGISIWVYGTVAWFALLNFRCPRCGKRFMLSWISSLPTDRCKHCGLDLGRGGPPGFLTILEEVFVRQWRNGR
jgi:hypothetical protein